MEKVKLKGVTGRTGTEKQESYHALLDEIQETANLHGAKNAMGYRCLACNHFIAAIAYSYWGGGLDRADDSWLLIHDGLCGFAHNDLRCLMQADVRLHSLSKRQRGHLQSPELDLAAWIPATRDGRKVCKVCRKRRRGLVGIKAPTARYPTVYICRPCISQLKISLESWPSEDSDAGS